MNIQAMAAGAADMEKRLKTEDATENVALRYAAIRNLLYRKGYRMEMLSFFEPRFFRFAKWWMQLFGESEERITRACIRCLEIFLRICIPSDNSFRTAAAFF